MHLSELLKHMQVDACHGDASTPLRSLHIDSRDVKPGGAFFAVKGSHHDGFRYIASAIKRGAHVVFATRIPKSKKASVCYVAVPDVRMALSIASSRFYAQPSHDIPVIGITGTDGKSTTTWFAFQLLKALGLRAGFLSTIASFLGDELRYNLFHQTTPEAQAVHKALADMRDAACEVALLESTSHGLSEKTHRLRDVRYYGALYTPIAHEHLDFHRSFDCYLSDKKSLLARVDRNASFPQLAHPPFAVFDLGNEHSAGLIQVKDLSVYGYAVEHVVNTPFSCPVLLAKDVEEHLHATSFTLQWGPEEIRAEAPIPSKMNVGNVLAATLIASLVTGRPVLEIVPSYKQLTLPRGRMQHIPHSLPFTAIVDFAHTPQAFERLFPFLASQKKARLIAVFGSAGERDREKRVLQGRTAAEYADVIVLTDEDPRGEDPMQILEEIASGVRQSGRTFTRDKTLFLIPDRAQAIDFAVDFATMDDMLVFLGKGHETSIIYKHREIPWDEAAAVQRSLSRHQL